MLNRQYYLKMPGFTLVEVLVSVTILSVGVLGMSRVIRMGHQATSVALRRDGAVAIADDLLTQATSVSRANAVVREGSAGPYQYSVSYEDRPDSLMATTVTIRWVRAGQSESIRFSELFLVL